MGILEKEFLLIESEKRLMLKIARESLIFYLKTGKFIEYDDRVLPANLLSPLGVFISLYKGKALRGCIGRLQSDIPVYSLIQKMTIAAAMHDSRFPKLKQGELIQIHIEISILTPLQLIDNYKDIVLGKHGIYIKKGSQSGTFLPQVADSTGWDLEEFLGHCSNDKAGMGWDGWKEAELFTYTADIFKE